MSLARTALRLATLEALRPTASIASDGPWPTIARKAVFDSRIDPLEDLKPGESQPVVCVYTDEDEGTSGQKAGGPPFKPRLIDGQPAVVRDPLTLQPLKPDGEWKPRTTYWNARLREGDVVETAPPSAEPASIEAPSEAPAAEITPPRRIFRKE